MIINEDFFDDSNITIEQPEIQDKYQQYVHEFELHYGSINSNGLIEDTGYEQSKKYIGRIMQLLKNVKFVKDIDIEPDDSKKCCIVKFNTEYTLEEKPKHVSEILQFLYIIVSNMTGKHSIIFRLVYDFTGDITETLGTLRNYFTYLKKLNRGDVDNIQDATVDNAIDSITRIMIAFFGVYGSFDSVVVKSVLPYYMNGFMNRMLFKIISSLDQKRFDKYLFIESCMVNKEAFHSLLDNSELYKDVEIRMTVWDTKACPVKLFMFTLDELKQDSTTDKLNVQRVIKNMLPKVRNFRVYPSYMKGSLNSSNGYSTVVVLYQTSIVDEENMCYYIQISGQFNDVEKALGMLFNFRGKVFR